MPAASVAAGVHENERESHAAWADQQQNSMETDHVECLRRSIKFYFMNPCEKYRARGRKPWKLVLQIIKIAIITIQLASFGLSNQMVVTFKEENLMTFQHLFLKDYVDGGIATYAIYRQEDVYDHIRYVVRQYGNLHTTTVGNHEYEKNGILYTPLTLCQEFYRNGTVYPGNDTFEIDAHVETDCIDVHPMNESSSQDVLAHLELHFKRMLAIKISFVLKAINLQTVGHRELPDCYDFRILITLDNGAHSGRIKVDLETHVEINECRDRRVTGASPRSIYLTLVFDCLIILTCMISFTLCLRSVLTGIQLQFEYKRFCQSQSGPDVPWCDRLEFINGWYILIIASDLLTIVGSVLKTDIYTKVLTSYDVCSIFLGTGTMFVWIGVIRYMGYFHKYNDLPRIASEAFPSME